jgi:hypothetical protein
MTTTVVIVLGILVWILLAGVVAVFVAQSVRLRDRKERDRTETGATEAPSGDDLARRRSRWRPRSKT